MTALHLVRIPVDLKRLAVYAHDRNRGSIRVISKKGREREAGVDEGRILHHLLVETFGDTAPKPFRLLVAPGKASASLYGYTASQPEHLRATASETALPEAFSILALNHLEHRELAATWTPGRRLGFDVRVRPVVRIRTKLPNPRDPANPYKVGAELDAYFVEAQRTHSGERPAVTDTGPSPSGMTVAGRTRDAVYTDWLAKRLQGATLVPGTIALDGYQRTLVARAGFAPEGPEATLSGELEVTDPLAFHAMLAAGIGRHKAYGYGMLMLRPARRPKEA